MGGNSISQKGGWGKRRMIPKNRMTSMTALRQRPLYADKPVNVEMNLQKVWKVCAHPHPILQCRNLHLSFRQMALGGCHLFLSATPHGIQDPSSPDQGSIPFPLLWKLEILTTGPPGKSQGAPVLTKLDPTDVTSWYRDVWQAFLLLQGG